MNYIGNEYLISHVHPSNIHSSKNGVMASIAIILVHVNVDKASVLFHLSIALLLSPPACCSLYRMARFVLLPCEVKRSVVTSLGHSSTLMDKRVHENFIFNVALAMQENLDVNCCHTGAPSRAKRDPSVSVPIQLSKH